LNQDAEGFISGLQKGGFATDPAYGDKLRRVIGSTVLRQGLAG
jgi:flagellum-specific peptidoglycan hydrolase FlgJ